MPIFGGFFPRQHSAPLLLRFRPQIIAILIVCITAVMLISAQEASATPAWARKYNADCAMCHYAAYPRLNSFGLEYRRMGYRTPNEVNKDQDIANVNNFLSGRIRTQLAYDNTKGTTERTEFRNAEISILYGGAISRHWSAFLHGFTETGPNGSNTDFHGHVMGMFGDMDKYLMVRFGQMHMLNQEGVGGFDRPVGITSPPIYTTQLTLNATPMTFNFDQRQRGAELDFVYGPGRLFGMVYNGLDETGSGTRRAGDIDSQEGFHHRLRPYPGPNRLRLYSFLPQWNDPWDSDHRRTRPGSAHWSE